MVTTFQSRTADDPAGPRHLITAEPEPAAAVAAPASLRAPALPQLYRSQRALHIQAPSEHPVIVPDEAAPQFFFGLLSAYTRHEQRTLLTILAEFLDPPEQDQTLADAAGIDSPARYATDGGVDGELAFAETVISRLATTGQLTRDGYAVLVRLTRGWAWVLERHTPDAQRRCTRCPRRGWRRKPWPCAVAREVRAAFTD